MEQTRPKKRILVVHYSQTGQLDRVLESVVAPLRNDPEVELDFLELRPTHPFPFPWPMVRFINAFPEAAHEKGCELDLDTRHLKDSYDLVVLGYQVWFLAPSIPVTGFLQSELAALLLKDTPVVTVIACRNMWLQAQEKVKARLERLGARLIGNAALVDAAGSWASFFATPLWVLTGHKGPFWFGLVPRAGVSEEDIEQAYRFGSALSARLRSDQPLDETVWQGLHAVQVNDRLIASEKVATRSFYLWGKLFLAFGAPDSLPRKPLAIVYLVFLVLMVITVVPVTAILKKLLTPFMRGRIARQKTYYAWPSGE